MYLLIMIVARVTSMNAEHADCGTTGAFVSFQKNEANAVSEVNFVIVIFYQKCGRGSRIECCEGLYCDIAPDCSYARCTPNRGKTGAFVSIKRSKMC